MHILLNEGAQDEFDTEDEDKFSLASIHLNEFSSTILTILLFILAVSVARIIFEHLHISFIPESGLIIILGCIFGAILEVLDITEHEVLQFNEHPFFLVIIPLIIFEAGYHLDSKAFFNNLGIILSLAFIGTFFNTIIIGYLIYFSSTIFTEEIPAIDCLIFGSLISAVDPVAVLAIFESIHVNKTLNIAVFGESVLNDAVSIVLYNVFLSMRTDIPEAVPALAVVKFIIVAGGGLLVGVGFALLSAFLTKYTRELFTLEPLIIWICAYLSFVVCEILSLSGIMGILFCGIVQNRYCEANIQHKSHTTLKYMMKMFASTAETLLFIQLGASTVVEGGHMDWDIWFIVITLITIVPIRFAIVYGITYVVNQYRIIPMSYKDQFIMAYGGLRGAIAFALAVILPEEMDSRPQMITTTLCVIWFTIFIQGGTIKKLLDLFSIDRAGPERKPTVSETVLPKAIEPVVEALELISGGHAGVLSWRQFLKDVDHFLHNVFVRGLYVEEQDVIVSLQNAKKKELVNELEKGEKVDVRTRTNVNLKRIGRVENDPLSTPRDYELKQINGSDRNNEIEEIPEPHINTQTLDLDFILNQREPAPEFNLLK